MTAAEDVAMLLSGYGPRVQLSVFEVRSGNPAGGGDAAVEAVRTDRPVEEQVRLYPLNKSAARQVAVIGARMMLGTPGFLDRHMSRYSHDAGRPYSRPVAARERPGQRPALTDSPRSVRQQARPPRRWRSGPQNARSRSPPRCIRRKGQPRKRGHRNS